MSEAIPVEYAWRSEELRSAALLGEQMLQQYSTVINNIFKQRQLACTFEVISNSQPEISLKNRGTKYTLCVPKSFVVQALHLTRFIVSRIEPAKELQTSSFEGLLDLLKPGFWRSDDPNSFLETIESSWAGIEVGDLFASNKDGFVSALASQIVFQQYADIVSRTLCLSDNNLFNETLRSLDKEPYYVSRNLGQLTPEVAVNSYSHFASGYLRGLNIVDSVIRTGERRPFLLKVIAYRTSISLFCLIWMSELRVAYMKGEQPPTLPPWFKFEATLFGLSKAMSRLYTDPRDCLALWHSIGSFRLGWKQASDVCNSLCLGIMTPADSKATRNASLERFIQLTFLFENTFGKGNII